MGSLTDPETQLHLVLTVVAFALGIVVGWMWWGRRWVRARLSRDEAVALLGADVEQELVELRALAASLSPPVGPPGASASAARPVAEPKPATQPRPGTAPQPGAPSKPGASRPVAPSKPGASRPVAQSKPGAQSPPVAQSKPAAGTPAARSGAAARPGPKPRPSGGRSPGSTPARPVRPVLRSPSSGRPAAGPQPDDRARGEAREQQ